MSIRHVIVAELGRSLVPSNQTILTREEIEVRVIRRGDEILRSLRLEQPLLLIVGPDLEDLSIVELTRKIRSTDTIQGVSMLMIASPIERPRVEEAVAAGVNGVLYRPIDAVEFDAWIGRLFVVPVRKGIRVLVQIRVDLDRHGFFSLGRSRDLSSTGILLEADREIETGRTIGIRFYLPGDQHEISLQGEVVRQHASNPGTWAYGVKFTGVDEAIGADIERFIERRSRLISGAPQS